MMQANLVYSKQLLLLSMVLHVLTLFAILFASHGIWFWLLLGLWLLSFIDSGYKIFLLYSKAILSINCHNHMAVQGCLRCDSQFKRITLLPGSWIGPIGMIWHWQMDGQRGWQVIMPDMLDKQSYRQLVVWARWCQQNNSDE